MIFALSVDAPAPAPQSRLRRAMTTVGEERNRDRIKSLLLVTAFHLLLGYALVTGLGVNVAEVVSDNLKSFNVIEADPPPPLPDPPPPQEQSKREAEAPKPEGAASPKNIAATPSPVIVPPPRIPLPVPPTIIVAPVPGQGAQANAGAAPTPGPGTGSGGQGTGTGSGNSGSGSGGGGIAVHASRIRGDISRRDFPRDAYRAGASGTTFVRLLIGTDGRVSQCTIDESSGHAALDALTCDLMRKRFLYEPARDAQGRPVPETVYRAQVWESRRR